MDQEYHFRILLVREIPAPASFVFRSLFIHCETPEFWLHFIHFRQPLSFNIPATSDCFQSRTAIVFNLGNLLYIALPYMSIVHYMQTTIYCSFRFIRLQKSAGNLFRYRRTVRLSADSHFSQMKVVCKTVSYVRHYSFLQNGTNPVIFVSVPFPLYSRIRYSHAPLWSDIFPALILPFTGKKEAHRLRGVPVTDSSFFVLSLTDQYGE